VVELPSVIALANIIDNACHDIGITLKPTESYMLAEYVLTELQYKQPFTPKQPLTPTEIQTMINNRLWHE
jgi:hypothetical protein